MQMRVRLRVRLLVVPVVFPLLLLLLFGGSLLGVCSAGSTGGNNAAKSGLAGLGLGSRSVSGGPPTSGGAPTHTNNWAVLVATSKFWFNYRHNANILSIYHTMRSFGVPDSQIILMLGDEMACNPRNAVPATIFNGERHEMNLYGDDIHVDFRGPDVSIDSFLRILTGRQAPNTPASKRLATDEKSNILIFMSGHGGEDFMKFQDFDHISGADISAAFQQMRDQRRFNEILFFADTCHAGSLIEGIRTPGVFGVASSRRDQNSYSRKHDYALGISVIDEFTSSVLTFFQRNERAERDHARKLQAQQQKLLEANGTDGEEDDQLEPYKAPTLATMVHYLSSPAAHMRSDVVHNKAMYKRDPREVPLSDFFASYTTTSPSPTGINFQLDAPFEAATAPDSGGGEPAATHKTSAEGKPQSNFSVRDFVEPWIPHFGSAQAALVTSGAAGALLVVGTLLSL